MTHGKRAVWTERLVLALILASLAGTLNLVLAIHRRVVSTAKGPKAADVVAPAPPIVAKAPEAEKPTGPKAPAAPIVPPKPVEDPTAPILARMDAAIAREAEAAREADRRAESLEKARQTAMAESQRWKRREMLVRQQVSELSRKAEKLEQDALTIDAERDVLARERDALKAALAKTSQHSGYAVLPYKGPNGTWRRPIVLECTGNTVKLQPKGPSFSMMDLSPLIHPRSSPIVLAIAREMMKVQRSETPDGAPAVPYLVFLVRPDGIRPYYQVRGRLEPLGIAFGYELIEQDLVVDIPDFDDVRTWDGTVPLDLPEDVGKPRGDGNLVIHPSRREDTRGVGGTWPRGDKMPDGDDANGPGTWPPGGGSQEKPGSDRRWPDLARADDPKGGSRGLISSSDGGTNGMPAPEIDLGGTPGRAGRSGGGGAGGSEDGSPDDFVWPTTSGATTANAGGAGRPMGRPMSGGSGSGGGFPGMTPGGAMGGDSTGSTGASSPGGSPRSGRMGSGGGGAGGGSPGGGSGSIGSNPGSAETGRFLSRPADAGQANVSMPGSGGNRGGTPGGNANRTGSGGGNPNSPPELEPLRPGLAAFGTPMPGGGGGADSSGTGTPAAPGTSPGPARAPGDAAGAPGEFPNGPPGELTLPAGVGGNAPADGGFTPNPAGPATGGGAGAGSATNASPPSGGAGNGGGGGGLDPSANPGQDATAGGGGTPGSNGPIGTTGSSGTSGNAKPSGTASVTLSGLPPSSSNAASGSNPPPEPSAFSGSAPSMDAGRPPTPLQAATGMGSPTSSFDPSSLLGGSPSTAAGSSMSGSSASSGSGSSGSKSSASGTPGSSSGGQPPSGMPSGMAGMSLPSDNASPDPDSEPDALKGLAMPHIETDRKPGAIDVPFEIVIVCRRDDLLLHPGGYKITAQSLQAGAGQGDGAESLLQRELKTMVRRRAQVDPLIRPQPRVKFLVETGGASTFWKARQQLTFSGLEWPMAVQVAGPQNGYLLDERIQR